MWTGNGGQMAGETRTKLEVGGKKQAAKKKMEFPGSKTGRSARVEGSEPVLREAAREAVLEKCEEIADSMVNQAIAGDLDIAKLLLTLVSAQPDAVVEKKKRRGRSLAAELAAEPPWQGPVDGLDSEADGAGLWTDEPIVARG